MCSNSWGRIACTCISFHGLSVIRRCFFHSHPETVLISWKVTRLCSSTCTRTWKVCMCSSHGCRGVWVDIIYVLGRVKAACMISLPRNIVLSCKYVTTIKPRDLSVSYSGSSRDKGPKRQEDVWDQAGSSVTTTSEKSLAWRAALVQRNDSALAKCFRKAELNYNQMTSDKRALVIKTWYSVCQVPERTKSSQSKRAEVFDLAHEELFGGNVGINKTWGVLEFTGLGVSWHVVLLSIMWPISGGCRQKSERLVLLGAVQVARKPFW